MTLPKGDLRGYSHRLNNPIKIWGRFTLDAVPVTDDPQGRGYTVARTAAGRYTVTFDDAAAVLYHASCTVQVALGNVDMHGQVGTFTPGGTGAATLILRSMTGNTETDVAVADYVNFEATLYSEALDA